MIYSSLADVVKCDDAGARQRKKKVVQRLSLQVRSRNVLCNFSPQKGKKNHAHTVNPSTVNHHTFVETRKMEAASIAVGLNKGHKVTKREAKRPRQKGPCSLKTKNANMSQQLINK